MNRGRLMVELAQSALCSKRQGPAGGFKSTGVSTEEQSGISEYEVQISSSMNQSCLSPPIPLVMPANNKNEGDHSLSAELQVLQSGNKSKEYTTLAAVPLDNFCLEDVHDMNRTSYNHSIEKADDTIMLFESELTNDTLADNFSNELLTENYQILEPIQTNFFTDVDPDGALSEQDEPFPGSDSDEYVPSEDGGETEEDEEVGEDRKGTRGGEDKENHKTDGELINAREDGRKRKRKSKGQGDSSQWKRAKNSQARLYGDAYEGFEKNELGKYQQSAPKEKRQLKARCKGHKTGLKGPQQKFECAIISDEERKRIFENFWKLTTWEAKKIFISGLVSHIQPKHRRRQTVIEESRKMMGFKYYLALKNETETIKRHVCKNMFLATFGLGEKAVRSWVLESSRSEKIKTTKGIKEQQPELSECSKNVVDFLTTLPKLESHYCRASSRKLYLEPIWNSYRHLHREFLNYCQLENKKPCSWRIFLKMFRSMNLEIYTPRKDQCNKCTMFKKGNLNQTDYDSHVTRKEQARVEKNKDKEGTNATDNGDVVSVYTTDLQAVLLCSRSQASAIYYKQKLKVHNLTYYNLKNKEVSCYLWHEGNGGLESDIFVSIMIRFLKAEIDLHNSSRIIIWSDGCCYQNRNVNMANGLLELAMDRKITIEQKYLEVGHTQMEVDSVHSVIERKLGKRREVSVPADYVEIIRSARENPSPYKVESLKFNDFSKYNSGTYASIRPGNKGIPA